MVSGSCFAQQSLEEVQTKIDEKIKEINKETDEKIKRVENISVPNMKGKSKTTSGIQYVDGDSHSKTNSKKTVVRNKSLTPKRNQTYYNSSNRSNSAPYKDMKLEEKQQEAIRMQNATNNYYNSTQPLYNNMSLRDHQNATINTEILDRNMSIDNLVPDRGALVVGDVDSGYVTEEKDGKDLLNLLNKNMGDSIQSRKIYYLYRGILMVGEYDNLNEAQMARKKIIEEVKQEEGPLSSGNQLEKNTYYAHLEWLEENLKIKEETIGCVENNIQQSLNNDTNQIIKEKEYKALAREKYDAKKLKEQQLIEKNKSNTEKMDIDKKNRIKKLYDELAKKSHDVDRLSKLNSKIDPNKLEDI